MRIPINLALVPIAATFLASCGLPGGNSEDFAVETKASPAQVMAALSQVKFDESQMLFGSLPITRDRPGEGQIGWTIQSSEIPDKAGTPGVFALRLEPLDNGKATRIHVAISVPPVRMLMGEPNKVLSEQKVEAAFRKILDAMAKHLNARSDTADDAAEMGRMLGAVAVAANVKLQSRANQLDRDPEAFRDAAAEAQAEEEDRQETVEQDSQSSYRDDAGGNVGDNPDREDEADPQERPDAS